MGNECGSDREICGGWSDMEHDSMTSDCYQGCFCDDGFIQTRAGVCIPEAECAPAGEITCLVAQFESYLTFFGFDPSLISGFDWSWSGIGHNCGTPTPPSPKTPKTKTPKTKTPKTKSPKTKTPKSGKGKTKTPKKSGKGKKSPKGKTGRRRRELDSPAPKDKKHTGKYGKSGKGKSGKGKSGKGKSGKGKSPKSGYYNTPSPSPVCYPNYLENFCSYVINNYSGDRVDRLSALCYGPFFSTSLNNVLYVQQFTATFGQQYSALFCPIFESGNFLIDLNDLNFGDFDLDIDFNVNVNYNIDFDINLVTNINTYQNVMIEFIQSCGFSRVIDQILIQLTMEFNWDDFYGEFDAVFEYFETAIAGMLLDPPFVEAIVLVDADVIDSLGGVIQVFITQNIEMFFSTNIQFSIGGSFDWDCSNNGWCFTPPQIPVPYESAEIACNSIGGQVAGGEYIDFLSTLSQSSNTDFWMHFDVSNACAQASGMSYWNMNLNAFLSAEHGYIDVGHSDTECSFVCVKPQAPRPPAGGEDSCHSIVGGVFEQYMFAVGTWSQMDESSREFFPVPTDAMSFPTGTILAYESNCGQIKFSLKCLKNNSDNLYYFMPCNSLRCNGFDREIWLDEEKLNGIIDGSFQMNCY